MSLEYHIIRCLASRSIRAITRPADLVPSAVLLLLLEKAGGHHILFLRRSTKVKFHKGEISLPGGRVDREDSSRLHTALREGEEEIGLHSKDVRILGRLDDMPTISSGFVITPFVGAVVYPYPFKINTDEVSKLFLIPLDHLINGFVAAPPPGIDRKKHPTAVGYYVYENQIIWGATARIVQQFLALL